MSAVLLKEESVVHYMYKNFNEYKEHRITMEHNHWKFDRLFSDSTGNLCVTYRKVIKSKTKFVRDIITSCHSKMVVIQTVKGRVLYNDSLDDLLLPNVLVNHVLLKKEVINYTEQNGIMKVIVLC